MRFTNKVYCTNRCRLFSSYRWISCNTIKATLFTWNVFKCFINEVHGLFFSNFPNFYIMINFYHVIVRYFTVRDVIDCSVKRMYTKYLKKTNKKRTNKYTFTIFLFHILHYFFDWSNFIFFSTVVAFQTHKSLIDFWFTSNAELFLHFPLKQKKTNPVLSVLLE